MSIVRLNPTCIECLLKKHLHGYPPQTPMEEQVEYMQRVLRTVAAAPLTDSAPVLVHAFERIQKKMFGTVKDYSQVKHHFNEVMMGYEGKIRSRLQSSDDPLKSAIQYAMTGNYIDFGAMQNVNEEKLQELIDGSCDHQVDMDTYNSLKKDLLQASNIVYLTDNCGEIVLDRLLIEIIMKLNPQAKVTVVVRGAPVLNDATMEDARQVGLTEVVDVVDNGSGIAGTCLEDVSAETLHRLEQADVILAKGQANFETLRGCDKNIYYIFMCKCKMFAERFEVPLLHGVLVNDRNERCR